ncbi:hypothetical protein BVG79_00822 [Ketogulonicigenium robustum]|uniref:Uncharacterized protein n=1 Tax=Ketogulonicigenium robustum TaxID=92947 RepID=A0A1W6NY77_9RHOB|nr:hypothetical protein [Ketogulonicigenium robustum]ARO14174.1 hypothetical protein BVG79_00822 [Ketogulonicigenium robustum]
MGFLALLHSLTSYIGFLATIAWAGAVLFGAGDVARFGGLYKRIYLVMMISTGLSGVFGLIVTIFGPWLTYVFPWIGLVGLGVHNMLGARSRKMLAADTGRALIFAAIQIAVLVVVLVLMICKPF